MFLCLRKVKRWSGIGGGSNAEGVLHPSGASPHTASLTKKLLLKAEMQNQNERKKGK